MDATLKKYDTVSCKNKLSLLR